MKLRRKTKMDHRSKAEDEESSVRNISRNEEKDDDEPKSIAPAGRHPGMHLDSRTAGSVRYVKN
jgi:hypothetical protein